MAATRALIRLTLRQAIVQRALLVAVLLAIPIGTALLLRFAEAREDPIPLLAGELAEIILTGIVPMLALLVAHGGLGHDVEDGTIITLLTTPVGRSRIVVVTMLSLGVTVGALVGAATLIAGAISLGGLDPTRLVIGLAVAAAIGGFLYTQLFLVLTLQVRRGLLFGLIYSLIWEGVLARTFVGLNNFSIRQYLRGIAAAITTVEPEVFTATLPLATAGPLALAIAVGTLLLCVARLRRFQLDRTP